MSPASRALSCARRLAGGFSPMTKDKGPRAKGEYTPEHARKGAQEELPAIETWPNQYRGYEITITMPEYTSICPRTGLPDFGTITLHYLPAAECIELKSLKYYILDYVVRACRPKWAVVRGEFTTRGGMHSTIEARYPRPKP